MGAPLPLAVSGDPERAAVLALLRAHGRETVSFQALEPGFERFVTADGAAAVGYVDLGRTWVTAGGPIAAADRAAAAFDEFRAFARDRGARVVWFGVETRPDLAHLAAIDVGRQPVWDPQRWPEAVRARRSLREQLRRARAKGVRVRLAAPAELDDPRAPLRAAIERLIARWRASRPMAPMDFVVRIHLWHLPAERRVLVAERDGALVGVLAAVPIYARDGWLLEDALRDPAAPNGTVELLFDTMLRDLAAAGSRYATFGLAPLAGVRSPVLRAIRRLGRPLYHFDGLASFKSKLAPTAWRPVHVVHDRGRGPGRAILAVLRAFAGGSLLGFGWRTALHRAPVVVAVLAWLLVPWTALLAVADTAVWFPSAAWQRGWVALDGVLFVGLLALARRWRRGLATALAGLAVADLLAGSYQWLWLGVPAVDSAGRVAVAAAALAAPGFAAVFLWQARAGPRAVT